MDSSQRRQTSRLGRGDHKSDRHAGQGGDDDIVVRQALALGLECHRAGDFQSAAEHYYDALEARRDQPDALHLLGLISFQSGDTGTAKRLIGRAIEVAVDDPVPHVTLGDILHAELAHGDAIASYIRGLEIDPELAEAHNNCGNAQNALGLFDDAAASFKHALVLKPGYSAALNNLGNVLRELGKYVEAISNYRQALAFHPDSAVVHNNLGNALRDSGDVHGAIECHNTALEIDPRIMEAHFNLGNAFSGLGDFETALVHYERAVELEPNFADGHYNLGNAWRERGEFQRALKSYHRTVSINPGHLDAYNNLGNVLADLGNISQAVAAYRIVLELDPANFNARHMATALSGETTSAAPPDYVRQLFDTHAGNYDSYVQDQLGYSAPAAIRTLIEDCMGGPLSTFARALDLGCGTGLTGQAFAEYAAGWVGVDLSPNMLAVAGGKNLYDVLHAAEICEFLNSVPTEDSFDLVLAGDVFAYTGDLDPLFEGVRRSISNDGVFAFTTERTDGGGYVLAPTGRYGHDDSYIRNLAAFRNFEIIGHDERTIRVEDGEPVIGSIFVLKPC
jgi:predicted TPR repeat methyltransferase